MSVRVLALAGALLVLPGCASDGGEADATTPMPAATTVVPTTAAPTTPAATTAAPTTPASSPGPVAPPPGDGDVPVLDGRVAALVLGVSSGGRVAFDPVQFLTGQEASAAARAHGDEDPPPNDFYIVNDDRALRDLPFAPGVAVGMLMDADGELCGDIAVGCPPMSVADWESALEGEWGDLLLSMPYWLTVSDGTVTAIEQQYVP